jgi:hypothetical protein
MKTHTIHWKSILNGKIGAGTFLFEKEEAERLAKELNQDYPGIEHEAVLSAAPQSESQLVQHGG